MSKRKKRRFIITGIIVALLHLCFTGWKISQYIVHSQGVDIEFPNSKYMITYSDYGFPRYKVFDKNWSEDRLGDSGWTIGEKGDFLCCVCSVMAAAGKNGDSTPDKINAIMCEVEGYGKNGDIKKDVLEAIAENVKYHNSIDPALKDNRVVKSTDDPNSAFDIVKVKKGDDYRWVVIKGIYGKDYWCMDPKEEKESYLSDYGSRVYEWYTIGSLQDGVNVNKKESVLERIGEIENRKRKRFIIVGEFVLLIVSWIIGRKIDHYMKQKG